MSPDPITTECVCSAREFNGKKTFCCLIRNSSTIEEYVGKLKGDHFLKKLIEHCGNLYLSLNNVGTDAEKQATVDALLKMIAEMIAINGGQVYKSIQFNAVAKVIDI